MRLAPGVEALVQPAFDQPSPSFSVDTDGSVAVENTGVPADDAGVPPDDGVLLRGHLRGRALAGALLTAVLDVGIDVRTGARAGRLVVEDGAVAGVVVDGELETGRVILATGGFQHDATLVDAHLPGMAIAPMGPAGCAGDGLRMACEVGAELANMAEGWWMPALHTPGEIVGGVAHYRPLHSERAQPGSLLVDGTGRRFVDEAQNYGDVGRAMRRSAGGAGGGAVWMVFDTRYRRRYPAGPLAPSGADPEWLSRAADVAGLARAIGVPVGVLDETVRTFNVGAARGEDPLFGRGARPYDRWIGDPGAPHPTLAPLCEAPFYALSVQLGCMGTKGGPRTDDRGRVLGAERRPVAGLYAAGNAAASPFGTATAAGGATLGPALVFGFRAGEAAAGDR